MPDQDPTPMIPPQPVPTLWGFDTTEEGDHVVVIAQTPLGTFIHFIQVDNVDKVVAGLNGEKAKAKAKKRAPDIVVPGQVLLNANGDPMVQVPPSEDVQEHLRKMREEAIDVASTEVDGESGDSDD